MHGWARSLGDARNGALLMTQRRSGAIDCHVPLNPVSPVLANRSKEGTRVNRSSQEEGRSNRTHRSKGGGTAARLQRVGIQCVDDQVADVERRRGSG